MTVETRDQAGAGEALPLPEALAGDRRRRRWKR